MRTLLIGANGQLGSEPRQTFSDNDLGLLTHGDNELGDRSQVWETLHRYRPCLILNTAAYHRVGECEDLPECAFAVNAVAARDLAIATKEIGAVLVVSTSVPIMSLTAGSAAPTGRVICPGR